MVVESRALTMVGTRPACQSHGPDRASPRLWRSLSWLFSTRILPWLHIEILRSRQLTDACVDEMLPIKERSCRVPAGLLGLLTPSY